MFKKSIIVLSIVFMSCCTIAFASDKQEKQLKRDDATTSVFRKLTKSATWELKSKIEMKGWQTFHTQGLLKIGDVLYVSAVEILEPREFFGSTDALNDFSIDRTAGTGRGWLFKFDGEGNLIDRVELTDGDIYHPGGIDYDGQYIWVPVSEYRPNSASNIYRVDPETMMAELAFTEKDHIGGVVHNTASDTFHGVSWGSRRLYTWKVDFEGDDNQKRVKKSEWVANPQHYIDYQDCHYAGIDYMLCGGLNKYNTPLGKVAFGGLELVDLRTNRTEHQVPVKNYIDEGAGIDPELIVSNNAFWAEPYENGLRVYFMTERNNQANLIIYQATPWQKK